MLHLTIGEGDKIFIGEGPSAVVVSLGKNNSGRGQVQISVNAPKEIPVNTIFADSSKQFKNRRRKTKSDDRGNQKDYGGNTGNLPPKLGTKPKARGRR